MLTQIWRHTVLIEKKSGKVDKLGGSIAAETLEAVVALGAYLRVKLAMDEQKYLALLGREVTEEGKHEDAQSVEQGSLEWFDSDPARKAFKLSFRHGKAYRKTAQQGQAPTLDLYDSDAYGEAIDTGDAGIFVMDARGRIYIGGAGSELAFKHSSFLAGGAVLAAGTMRVVQGSVVLLTGRSGHYRPTVQQMVNVLERLRAYQVKLAKITVYRENFVDDKWKNARPKFLEPCPAETLLQMRVWPGSYPHQMRVG